MPKSQSEIQSNCILYELLVYSEWTQDPEPSKSKTGDGYTLQSLFRYLRRKGSVGLDHGISKLLVGQLPWQFAVGGKGKVVAVLQDTLLEIRSTKDEYSSIIGRASVAKDAFPQYRRIVWSPDFSMLAISQSSGVVSVYDLFGSVIITIQSPNSQAETPQCDTSFALAGLLFIEPRVKNPKWSHELIAIDFRGNLRCYLVSPTGDFEENHTFTFGSHYRSCLGVTSVTYHPSHNLLFVAGPTKIPKVESLKSTGSPWGVFAWRLLNDFPHYRFALAIDEKQAVLKAQTSLWNWMPSIRGQERQSIIFKMQVSPNGKLLACLHSCGGVSLWHLPAIRLSQFWELGDQPDFDARNPQISERRRPRSDDEFYPIDVNWWSDNAVIIARNSGSVSVCSVKDLGNLLGASPEFLCGHPQVSAVCNDRGFLGLECETMPLPKRKLLDVSAMSDTDGSINGSIDYGDEDDDDDEDGNLNSSILEKSVSTVQAAVYMMTDIEKFQPQRKKPKLIQKAYRLLGLKSTTPEELYARKIDNEEYGEALALAKAYSLDCDLVYQRQWRNSKVSIATIHDYLSKITKRSWVLQECVERIPDTLGAARELLMFGLRGTNLETLVAIGDGTDGGHFVSPIPEYDDMDDLEVDEGTAKLRTIERNQNLLAQMISPTLSSPQKDLLRYRQQLLRYLDRLSTYELILGGFHLAEDGYNAAAYDHYRSSPALTSVVEFARDGDWQAVRVMFTYHGNETLKHWLPVLSNFPESMNPLDYRPLLPECNGDGDVFLWEQEEIRERDWCEREEFQTLFYDESPALLYEEESALEQFSSELAMLTADTLSGWYACRIEQVESRSCMVDYALTLAKLARERNIPGLDNLFFYLLTLETLVYEVFLEDVHLDAVRKLSDLEIAKLIMSKTSKETFVSDLKHLLLPCLLRCEKRTPNTMKTLLKSYLLGVSSEDLALPLRMFEYLRENKTSSLLLTIEDTLGLVLDCLYAYQRADQLDEAFAIMKCVPERGFGPQSPAISRLHDQLDELETDLRAAAILERNSIKKPLCFIRDNKNTIGTVKPLFIKLARTVAKKVPPPTELQWSQLLADMEDLQEKVFTCLSVEQCFEIYVATLLASGNKANIRSASDILKCRLDERLPKKVTYNRSVALVLDAASEYFDSAGSLTDPAMELAKACLHLITDANKEVEERLDLIASLTLLNDFGISMLPLQVRVCADRMRLIEACVRNRPSAYRNAQRLLQLAHKLRVSGSDHRQREGKVLALIAETALKAQDYGYCAEKCQELVAKSHVIGWEVVQRLGQCEDYPNLQVRSDLLAFALLYCTPDSIETLVNTRCLIEARLLHEKIASKVRTEPDATGPEEEEFSDALTSPMSPDKEFLPMSSFVGAVGDSTEAIKQTTFNLLMNVGNKHFWKNTFGWVRGEDSEESLIDEDEPYSRQGFPAFYASLCADCHPSALDTRYEKYSMPDYGGPTLQMCRAMFRMALLEETAAQGCCVDNSDVLLQLSEQTLAEDSCLGLSQLLTLRDPSRSDSCFRNLPYTEISLQLATYYYALQAYRETLSPEQCTQEVYHIPPAELVCRVNGFASSNATGSCLVLFRKYQELLEDYLQAKQLNSLGCGIDVQRFTRDTAYCHDTILGLAMSTDTERFDLSLTLGVRHNVPVGLIAASHATSLLLCGGQLSLANVTNRLADPSLIKLLKTSPQTVCERLEQYVYPSLSGTDHELLLLYYTLLNSIAEELVLNALTPREHIRLLKKLKAILLGVDYKKLVEEPQDMVAVFEPILTHTNVGHVGKLLKSLPESLKCTLQLGSLYSVWAKKEFFQIQKVPNSAPIATDTCLEHYNKCSSHFNKMMARDVLSLLREICFSDRSLDMMSIDCRQQIINQARIFCDEKSRQLSDQTCMEEWRDVAKTFEQWRDHLLSVDSMRIDEKSKFEMRPLLRSLDLSRGESGPIRQLLQNAILSPVPIASLKLLLTLLPRPSPSLQQLLDDALSAAVSDLKANSNSSLLTAVLRRMQENVDASADGTSAFENSDNASSIVREKLEPLSSDLALDPTIRILALQLLQSLKLSTQEDNDALLFHRTEAAVALTWQDESVGEEDTRTVESRESLFKRLAERSHSWQQIESLFNLIRDWPKLPSVVSSTDPWIQLVIKILHYEEGNTDHVVTLLNTIFHHANFSEASLRQSVMGTEHLPDQTIPLLVLLLADFHQLHLMAANIICKYQQVGAAPLSPRILSLVLKRGLAAHIVSSPSYAHLVNHVLQAEAATAGSTAAISRELAAAGSICEAGTLRLLQAGAPASLRVFSAAIAITGDSMDSNTSVASAQESDRSWKLS